MAAAPSKQQRLFDDEPAAWEVDDEAERLIATVVFPQGPPKPLDYVVPDRLRGDIADGCRVRAPLGRTNRRKIGYCVALESRKATSRRLKDLVDVIDRPSLLSPAMLRLTRWIADYYLCPWGQVLEAIIPAGVREGAGTKQALFVSISPEVVGDWRRLKLSAKQQQVLSLLSASPRPLTQAEVAESCQCTTAPIMSLRRRGLIRTETRRVSTHRHAQMPIDRRDDLSLNDDQQRALDAVLSTLHSGQHRTVVLHGVTGSGKTEVYIRAIQEMVRFGRQAIVLVPEISLTPQTIERFRERFSDVAVLHSHLTPGERHWHWQQIAAGHVPVVVGARSAVFAPTPHLGLIVLDEEHEWSFKQDSAPRYHARDVARWRAETEGVPLVLGSATPSLETYQAAHDGKYGLVELPDRVLRRPLPEVGTIDLRAAVRNHEWSGSISRHLALAMDAALADGGQVILLLNRRGYSTHIQCQACGAVVRCPDCDLALTHHLRTHIALCHYCDYEIPPPKECPECRAPTVRYGGMGTQRLEQEVQARFGGYPCLRMDTDSMRRPGSHEKALSAFRAGEVRILLGTQMIAKGLDFPNVTLVGVVNADTALHFPDFRAAERTFQLLVQVAGRTGRGDKGGRVLIQTFSPEHPAIRAAVKHDYHGFAAAELPIRQSLGYPPFTSMIRLVIRGPRRAHVEAFAGQLADEVKRALGENNSSTRVLGPAPAPLSKLRGLHRFQIQVQSPDLDALRSAVSAATEGLKPPEDVQWIADVDPLDML